MTMDTARDLAIELMTMHGLIKSGWTFHFDHSQRRFGVCKYGRKEICLSWKLTIMNEDDEVKETILHEIAHALVPARAGHGRVWKEMAARVGANPVRCYDSKTVEAPKLRFQGTCPTCGREFTKSRLPKRGGKRVMDNFWCKKCGRVNGRIIFVDTKAWKG